LQASLEVSQGFEFLSWVSQV